MMLKILGFRSEEPDFGLKSCTVEVRAQQPEIKNDSFSMME
jgi:hypothetical protein